MYQEKPYVYKARAPQEHGPWIVLYKLRGEWWTASHAKWSTAIQHANIVAPERFADDFGTLLVNVHNRHDCDGPSCTIHNPSDHIMRDFKLLWRADRGMFERICPDNGIGHPDPDQVAFWERHLSINDAQAQAVHGCDGCCYASEGVTEATKALRYRHLPPQRSVQEALDRRG